MVTFKRLILAAGFGIFVSAGVMLSDAWRDAPTGARPTDGTFRVREIPDSDRIIAHYFRLLAAGIGAGVGMFFFSRKYMPGKED